MTFLAVITAVVNAAVSTPLASGQSVSLTRFSVVDSSGAAIVPSQDVQGLSASFSGLPSGTFTAQAQYLDNTGALLGDPVTAAFVDGVAVAPATFNPLASLSVTVTEEASAPVDAGAGDPGDGSVAPAA